MVIVVEGKTVGEDTSGGSVDNAYGFALIVVAVEQCEVDAKLVGWFFADELDCTKLCAASIECSLRASRHLYSFHVVLLHGGALDARD